MSRLFLFFYLEKKTLIDYDFQEDSVMKKNKKILPLYKWIKDNNIKLFEFAEINSLSKTSVSRVFRGVGYPNFKTVIKIMEATNYEVSANDIFRFEERKKEFLENKNK